MTREEYYEYQRMGVPIEGSLESIEIACNRYLKKSSTTNLALLIQEVGYFEHSYRSDGGGDNLDSWHRTAIRERVGYRRAQK